MWHNIPDELKRLPQWLVWRGEPTESGKVTKKPYNPATGRMAKTDDPATWVTFEYACQAANAGLGYDGIGFVFTKDDDYAGIDLDATDDAADFAAQQKIYEAMDSYSEMSPSGNGLHVIVKGYVPEGRKRRHVELYSWGRFFTMTGNVYRQAPIAERQNLVSQLYKELSESRTDLPQVGETFETVTDAQVYELGVNAVNGDKFQNLWRGDWKLHYSSQSEADLALINMLGYYSRHTEQIERLFMRSGLGQRQKAKRRNYVRHMAIKSFDNAPPPIDFDSMKAEIARYLADAATAPTSQGIGANAVASTNAPLGEGRDQQDAPSPYLTPPPPTYDGIDINRWRNEPPPGLLGDMVEFIKASSPRPLYDVSLVSALGLMAGMVGRQYNVSNTGLQQYLILFAASARGKEALKQGIDKIVEAVSHKAAVIKEYRGPSDIASGQAILKHLSQRPIPCCVSVIGEFGQKMQEISTDQANSAQRAINRVLLDLYNKSGATNSIQPSIYADSKNNTDELYSPALTLVGETIPEEFFNDMSTRVITNGLLPRFVGVHYKGKRPPHNYNHDTVSLPDHVAHQLAELVTYVNINANNRSVINVEMRDKEADDYQRWVNEYCDHKINKFDGHNAHDALWSRVHLKMLKLAAILAVSENYTYPKITRANLEWALSMVLSDVIEIESKLDTGEIVSANGSDHEQEKAMVRCIREYLEANEQLISTYRTSLKLHQNKIIPLSYLNLRLRKLRMFRDKFGGNGSENVRKTVNLLVDQGILRRVPDAELMSNYGFTGRAFVVSDVAYVFGD